MPKYAELKGQTALIKFSAAHIQQAEIIEVEEEGIWIKGNSPFTPALTFSSTPDSVKDAIEKMRDPVCFIPRGAFEAIMISGKP
jgi:hypothetical protein